MNAIFQRKGAKSQRRKEEDIYFSLVAWLGGLAFNQKGLS
jgi:hypothetical protein